MEGSMIDLSKYAYEGRPVQGLLLIAPIMQFSMDFVLLQHWQNLIPVNILSLYQRIRL